MSLDDDFALWELVQTSHVVARGFYRVFGDVGLSPTQFGVLAELEDRRVGGTPSPSQAELARVVLMRPQSMGELVASLVERGLVVRDGPAGRGRRTGLSITDEGRDAVHRAMPGVHAFHAAASTGLDETETAELVRMLRRIRDTLTATEAHGDR